VRRVALFAMFGLHDSVYSTNEQPASLSTTVDHFICNLAFDTTERQTTLEQAPVLSNVASLVDSCCLYRSGLSASIFVNRLLSE